MIYVSQFSFDASVAIFLGNGMLAGLKVRRNSIFVGQTGRRKSKFVANLREKAGSSEGAQ